MRALSLIALLAGCKQSGVVDKTPEVSGDTGHSLDSGPDSAADSGPNCTLDSGPDSAPDSVPPGDTGAPLEQVPAADPPWDPLDGLCQLALDCGIEPTSSPVSCTFSVTDEQGTVWYSGAASAWRRGRSSSRAPKGQYAVELQDEAGADTEVDLLGMGADSDWVLQGNWFDRSLVRNRMAFDLFQSWGDEERYDPQSGFCELTLNGSYWGVYSLAERIKKDGSRIDLEDAGDDGGSFVITQIDHECFYNNLTTYGCWKLIYPNEDTISDSAKTGIATWLASMEGAVRSADPYDPETGVFAYVDEDSLIDTIILEEFFRNEDSWYTSMHAWKDRDGLLHYAPWDLDMTFGNLAYYADYGDPHGWINYRPEWITVMSTSPDFSARLSARWAELRADSLSESAINARIDRYQAILGDAIDRNFERWPIEEVNYGTYFYEVNSYPEEDAHVRDWISQRLWWIDENIGSF